MSINDLKFKSGDFTGQDISSLPDRPNEAGINATSLKAMFDNVGKVMIALGKFNDLIDAFLSATDGSSGADNVAATPIEGLAGGTVQSIMESLKDYATNVAGDATEALQRLEEAESDIDDLETNKANAVDVYTKSAADAEFVDKTSTETVTGKKTFTQAPEMQAGINLGDRSEIVPLSGGMVQLNAKNSLEERTLLRLTPESTNTPEDILSVGNGAYWYKLWHQGNMGAGKGLDADLLDGKEGATYVNVITPQDINGRKTFNLPPWVPDPVNNQDATNKAYVDSKTDNKVLKAGDSMSGDLNMSANNVTGLADPVDNTDAVNKQWILAQLAALHNLDVLGKTSMTAASEDLDSNKMPTSSGDVKAISAINTWLSANLPGHTLVDKDSMFVTFVMTGVEEKYSFMYEYNGSAWTVATPMFSVTMADGNQAGIVEGAAGDSGDIVISQGLMTVKNQSVLDKEIGGLSVSDSSDVANGDSIVESVGKLQAQSNAVKGDIGAIEGDIGTIEGNIGSIEGDIETIEGDISALQTDVTDLENELGEYPIPTDIITKGENEFGEGEGIDLNNIDHFNVNGLKVLATDTPYTELMWYVDGNSGDDETGDGLDHPYKTISRALENIPEISVGRYSIYILGGNFGEVTLTGKYIFGSLNISSFSALGDEDMPVVERMDISKWGTHVESLYLYGLKCSYWSGSDISWVNMLTLNHMEFIATSSQGSYSPLLTLNNINRIEVDQCYFDGSPTTNATKAIRISGSGAYLIRECTFNEVSTAVDANVCKVHIFECIFDNMSTPEDEWFSSWGATIIKDGIDLSIADNLTTTEPGKKLDARQGKVLADEIVVRYDVAQSLTMAQRHQARLNIGAAPVIGIKDAYELQAAIRAGYAQSLLSVGDFFTVGRGGTDWLFQVAAFDYDVPADPNFTHSMRLLMYPVFDNVVYDAREAIYAAEAELPAGIYWLIDSRTGKYFSFSLTQPLPEGGHIVYSGYGPIEEGYLPPAAITYASQTSTEAIETATITVESEEPPAGTQLTPVNEGHRARFGSGNWLQSAIRQWLNSDKESGWWVPSNTYDRPRSTPASGFLHGIDEDFLACIGKVRLRTGLNPYDNDGTFGYSDNEEFVFLLSRTEMGLGNSGTGIYETPVTAEGEAKTDVLPLFNSNQDRVKYMNGVALSWWVRSPLPDSTGAGSSYCVSTTGALTSNGALGARGAVPACTIY